MARCPSACAWALCLLLALTACSTHAAKGKGKTNLSPKRTLKRNDAKRWQRLKDVAKAQIKVSTKKFLNERDQRLAIPLEVDIMMLGFDGDGAYHYRMNLGEMHELLSAQYTERDVCPTILDTGEESSVCLQVSTTDLPAHDYNKALPEIEAALRRNMKLVGHQLPYVGAPADGPKTSIYEIDAAKVEGTINNLLIQAYRSEGFDSEQEAEAPTFDEDGMPTHRAKPALEHRVAIVVINPSKQRMNPAVTEEVGREQWTQTDILGEWRAGKVNSTRVREAEAGYIYRYSYNGKGSSEAWISSHNFILLDLSAGPSDFGPLATVSGITAPTGIPRIEPMMEGLAMEVEDVHQITLHDALLHDAMDAHHRILMGHLASTISAAINHVMAPDIATTKLEVAQTLLLSVVVLQDHDDFHLLENMGRLETDSVEQQIDTQAVQNAMEELMPKETTCVMMPSSRYIHHMPSVLMALSRARTSWSNAVMLDGTYAGMHHAQHTKIDSKLLMEELRQFIPTFTGDAWAAEIDARSSNKSTASGLAHQGMRHLPVIVLSLKSAPAGLLFENNELVVADHDMVVVLQLVDARPGVRPVKPVKLLPKPQHITAEQESAGDKLRLYSGHQIDRHPLELDGANDVTAHIIAGMTMALGGVVPLWERADEGKPERRLQDWRWGVGCVPYGPYGNCTTVSGLIKATARRNQIIAHIQTALNTVQLRLDDMDALVHDVYEGPWKEFVGVMVPSSLNETRIETDRHRHWLDVLNSRSKDHTGPINPGMIISLENDLAAVESHITSLAWVLFSQTWDNARDMISDLLTAADEFVNVADQDIARCKEIAGCCSVRHGLPMIIDSFLLVVFIFLVLLFAVVVILLIASKKVYRTPRGPVSPPPSSLSRSQGSFGTVWSGGLGDKPPSRTSTGLLPSWNSGSASGNTLLPR